MTSSTQPLSAHVLQELDHLIARVARQTGHVDGESVQDKLARKLDQQRHKMQTHAEKVRVKIGAGSASRDFQEEMRSYLADSIRDFMNQGMNEDEALRATQEEFDEAEISGTASAFATAFGDFGTNFSGAHDRTSQESVQWWEEHGEAVGLFYAGFVVLGVTGGALVGFLTGGWAWAGAGIGAAAGFGFGVAGGLLSNGIILARNKGK